MDKGELNENRYIQHRNKIRHNLCRPPMAISKQYGCRPSEGCCYISLNKVIKAWGFKYKTCAFCWVKQNPKSGGIYSGLGHWTNGNAELCLFAKKGTPHRVSKNVKQIVLSPRGRHSEKPAEVRERIVQLMGDGTKIELFARQYADGWDCWGNEV